MYSGQRLAEKRFPFENMISAYYPKLIFKAGRRIKASPPKDFIIPWYALCS